ncbi:MAG: arginine--tRNA ligase [Candidatus Doudnabacteria bacterium]|nr:arginine--tRNA ligase [Candidatus Doudnabacteria bacterium]
MPSETAKLYLSHLLAASLSNLKLTPYLDSVDISFPEPKFGDFSTNAALILAKKTKAQPVEISKQIIEEIQKIDDKKVFGEITTTGGFINFKLSDGYLLKTMQAILDQRDLFGCSLLGEGKTVVVEYFQNNVAKPPHVGHLRSAIIGDCLLRVLKSQGFKTISDTHIGDWGVQFGILLYAFKTLKPDMDVLEKDPINELNKLYVAMSAQIEAKPELRDLAKAEFKKLEDGDEQNRKLWQWFVDESLKDFERYRLILGILPFDYNLGESFYEKHMPEVLAEFEEKKLISKGETGELYVDLENFGLGRCILIKSDGATTYHLRDFATYIYRKKQFNFYRNIYEVDNRQAHHFKQLFKSLELAGYPAKTDSVHVEHGYMSLPEGAISTRKGTTISLQNLITEAEKRAAKIIEEKNPDLENKASVAKQVALAAIKYFDLSHNRKTEIVFTWDKALSFEGNTGPYLQYTHARIHGIIRKFQISTDNFQINGKFQATNFKPEESAVLRKLVQFPEIVAQVTEDYYPNNLCNYLFELSQTFNAFYQEIPVLQEKDESLKSFRLNLIAATAQVIKNGLYLLGLEAPEEM